MTIVPLHKVPSKAEARKIIRELVEAGDIVMHVHAHRRSAERRISMPQVLTVLKTGRVDEEPHQSLKHQGWETAMEGNAAGEVVRVAVCMKWSQRLLIITVI